MKTIKHCSMRILVMLLVLCAAFLISSFVSFGDDSADFAGGDGTADNPYQISNKYQLDNIRNYPNANFVLINDIIFDDIDFQEGGSFYNNVPGPYSSGEFEYGNYVESGWMPIPEFNGTLYGNGYSITNLKFSRVIGSMMEGAGFIAVNNGSVSDVMLCDCNFVTESIHVYLGSLCGKNYGTITNCVSSGLLNHYYNRGLLGGIAGFNQGQIVGCISYCKLRAVEASLCLGGIVSHNQGIIKNCVNYGPLYSLRSMFYGSVCSINEGGTITNCYSVCDGLGSFHKICFDNTGEISNTYLCTKEIAYKSHKWPDEGNQFSGQFNELINSAFLNKNQIYDKENFKGFDFGSEWSISDAGLPYPSSNTIQRARVRLSDDITKTVSNFKAQPYSYKAIKLSWDSCEGCDGYVIYKDIDTNIDLAAKNNFPEILTVVGPDTTEYIHEVGANSSKLYSYYIVPILKFGDINFEGFSSQHSSSYVVDTTGTGLVTPDDTVGPVVNEFKIVTDEIYSPGLLKTKIDVNDSGSGLKRIRVTLIDDSSQGMITIERDLTGKSFVGDCDLSIETGTPAGNYRLFRIEIFDNENNVSDYGGTYFDTSSIAIKDEFHIEFTGILSNSNVARELANMEDGKTVVLTIDDASNGILKKECLDAIRGQDKTIVVYTDSSASLQWVFYGKDITGETKDLDLKVMLDAVDGEAYSTTTKVIRLTFADNGVLPGTVNLRLKSDYIDSIYGLNGDVYLYYENGNNLSLESTDCSVIKDGSKYWVYFDLTHNSTFLLSGEPLSMPDRNIAKATIIGISDKTYTGKTLKPAISVELYGKTLNSGTDYTVSYSNNKNVGTAAITINGIGLYEGNLTESFRINPKGTTLYTPKAARKAITVKWKKQTKKMAAMRISGYQIQCSTDMAFEKDVKTATVKGYKKTSKKISKLKSKKQYYIRIRTYMKVKGKTYYSSWSKPKKTKAK